MAQHFLLVGVLPEKKHSIIIATDADFLCL